MSYVGSWKIDDLLTFVVNTQVFATGVATDADSAPAYRVYEDETGTPILTGTMALLDSANTAGFYSEQITLSAANGFEKGKAYSIYIAATVSSVAGATSRTFQIQAAVDTISVGGTAQTAGDIIGDTNDIQARLPAALTANGNMKASLVEILTTALTETAGLLAGGFKKFFNVAAPTGTVNSLPDAVAGAASGLALVGSNVGVATSVSGAVGSVTGAVGSVTGAVGSVTGNVGGNVTGSVGSLAAQAKADVNAEVLDVISVDTFAEPTGAPAATTTLIGKLGRLYQSLRNGLTVTATDLTFKDDSNAALWKKALSDDGVTYTEGEGTVP